MNKRRTLTITIRIIAASFLIYWIFQFGSSLYSLSNDFKAGVISKTPAIDSSYDDLFKKEKLTSGLTYYIRGKEPFSTYSYTKNTAIVILEMQGVYAKPINDAVSVHKKSTERSNNVSYNSSFQTKLVEIGRLSSLNDKVSHLNLNLSGDSISLEENTAQLIYYRFKLDNMSISYGNSDLINFHMAKRVSSGSTPEIELMLKKHKQKIYLILAIPKEEDVAMPKNLLLSILK